MKKIFPFVASLLLLASCGSASSPSSSAQQSQKTAEQTSEPTPSSVTNNVLTFLNDGEIYIDFNFSKAPEGLAIKIGEQTLTTSGKVKMSQNFTYEVSGTFDEKLNVYQVIDTGGAVSAGKGEGVDPAVIQSRIERYLKNFSEKQYGYRIYFCISDQASGWSKTLEGVDKAMTKYAL